MVRVSVPATRVVPVRIYADTKIGDVATAGTSDDGNA